MEMCNIEIKEEAIDIKEEELMYVEPFVSNLEGYEGRFLGHERAVTMYCIESKLLRADDCHGLKFYSEIVTLPKLLLAFSEIIVDVGINLTKEEYVLEHL
ncbi:hypothetical protein Avbf_16849 [Armadillidium vulgare]|nr:hypothetical protein Avbf_16849 [Armadillidium vulgare]